MARQPKKKKSILQEIRETIHSLTKPKRSSKKANKRRAPIAKSGNPSTTRNKQELQKRLEQKITKKLSDDMQKMKQQVQQELLEQLTNQRTLLDHDNKSKTSNSNKSRYKPQTDCTFVSLLVLSDREKGEVVVGYEVQDNTTQEVWGIGIYEGTSLGRSKVILNTKVKSRKTESGRQYYLVNDVDETLYFTNNYKKPALLNGKVTSMNYTDGLANAIQEAYMAGYKSNSKLPNLRLS